MFDLPSILPPNHTAVEAALEQAIRKGKPDLTPIAKLMNPDTCPDDLLGWLAWTFSVDVWDANWSEMIKREVIRRSIAIHRIKGTVGSVRRALATISFRSDISEWFEHSGDPHTFRIDVFADDIFDAGFQIDAKLHALVTELIQNVKPVRAHFTLRIGEKKGGNSIETGIMHMLTMMETGRFKVFSTLTDWWEEFRMYHRKDNRVVPLHDDLMASCRYGVMSTRFAVAEDDPTWTNDVKYQNYGIV